LLGALVAIVSTALLPKPTRDFDERLARHRPGSGTARRSGSHWRTFRRDRRYNRGMRARRRRELFSPDRGLVARMVVAAVVTPLAVLAALALVVALAPLKLILVVALASIVGTVAAVRERAAAALAARTVSAADAPELHAVVERLCVVADLPKPAIVIEPERQPNSWIVGVAPGRCRLHLTQGLLDCLEPHELEAVVAHELAHVAHRDAAVMTVVGGPGAVLLGGGLRIARKGWWPLMIGGLMAAAIGWVGSLGSRTLSRYREFAADAGSVALTGSAAALASALTKVSDGLVAIPTRDLRTAAARDAFNLLPAARDREGRVALPATHPPLRARIERLERMERRLQRAR
jgi:heat shock protein HtpX